MLTLAIDCSARFCAAALYDDGAGAILAAESRDIGRGHAEQLPAIVKSVFDQADVRFSDVGRLGVTIGPGSFAGIRVGVAFARGLALALNVPAVGVGTLEAIAHPAAQDGQTPVMAVLDARRDRVWALVVDAEGGIIVEAAELKPEAAAALAAGNNCQLTGSGAALLAAVDPDLVDRVIGDPAAPDISDVARIAARLDPSAHPAEPRYLRDADAKPQIGFALPHEARA